MTNEQKQEQKHTALPWKQGNGWIIGGSVWTQDESARIIPLINPANAAYIVKACNSHYELVEALKHFIESSLIMKGETPLEFKLSLEKAKQALARAQG